MRRNLAVSLVFLLFAGKIVPQVPLWQWAVQIASPGNEVGFDLCTNAAGDVFVCGSFGGNLGSVFGLPFVAPAQKDGFVAKYNSAGNLQWAISIGGFGNDEIKGIALDANDNIYVTGYFSGTTDFDPGIFSISSLTSAGGTDGFVAKYSSGGSLIWATKYGGTGDEEGSKIAVADNHLYISGSAQAMSPFYSTGTGSAVATATQGSSNFFAARYDLNGDLNWVVSGGSNGPDLGMDLCADSNRVYISGTYQGAFQIYDASAAFSGSLAAQSTNKSNVFVLSYNKNGTLAWATNASSGDNDFAYGITQDTSKIFIAGGFKNSFMSFPYPSPTHTATSAGNYDIFLAALQKTNGSYLWVSPETGSGPNDEIGYVLECDASGDLYLGAGFKGVISYSANGGPVFNSLGNDDVLVTAFSNSGSFLWSTHAGGGNIDRPYGIGTHSTGALFVCGEHANGVSFGTHILTNSAGKNVFIAKTGCEGVSNNNIVSSQTLCAGGSPPTFTGSVPSVVGGTLSYVWQQSSNTNTWMPAPGSNTTQNYLSPPLSDTMYFRRVVMASGSCTFASNTLSVVINDLPSPAIAGQSQTVCATSTTLNASAPATGTGSWTVLSGSATAANPASANTAITNLGAGSNTFLWSVSNGVCPVNTSTVSIWRDLPPTPLSAGINQTVCSNSATLAALTPSIGQGNWTLLSGSATITAANSTSAQLSGLSAGDNIFQWTITNGICPAATASVSVQRDIEPGIAQVSVSQTLCANSVSLTGNAPLAGSGSWTVITGTATLSSLNNTSTIASGLQTGANIFQWQLSNGVCAPSSATTMVFRDALPDPASAGPSQSVCGSTATLSANTPTTGTGSWALLSGTASIITATNPVSQVTGLTQAQHILEWTIQNGTCPPSSSTVSLISYSPSLASVSPAYSLCHTSASLAAQSPLSGTGSWSVNNAGIVISNSLLAQTTAGPLDAGANEFYWTVVNGVCPPATATLVVWRDEPPTPAIAGSDQAVCSDTTTLLANQPLTGTGSWSVLGGGSVIHSALNNSTGVSGLAPGSNIFEWKISNGLCPASTSTLLVYRDLPPDQALAGPSQTLCAEESTVLANTPLTGTGAWSTTGSAIIVDPQAAGTVVQQLEYGQNTFVWTTSNGSCPINTDTLTIFRDTPPDNAIAGNNQHICETATLLQANSPQTGYGSWTVHSGNAIISNSLLSNSAVQLPEPGTAALIWKISNYSCPASSDTVLITRDSLPDRAYAGDDQSVCGNTLSIQGNVPLTGKSSWKILEGAALIDDIASSSILLSHLSEGSISLLYEIRNGVCPSSADTLNIKVYYAPGPLNAGTNRQVCSSEINLSASTLTAGTGEWSLLSGSALIIEPDSPESAVRNLKPGQNIFVWRISNGVCAQQEDQVQIERDSIPEMPYAGDDQETEMYEVQLDAQPAVKGTGSWQVLAGDAVIDDVFDPKAIARGLQSGKNIFRWQIDQGTCGKSSDDVVIVLREFLIPNAISPNGDGKNDSFYITSLSNYNNVSLTVYNRWGAVVYRENDYRNNWDGTNMQGTPLTDDTYYYVLEIPDKGNFTGFITIKKN